LQLTFCTITDVSATSPLCLNPDRQQSPCSSHCVICRSMCSTSLRWLLIWARKTWLHWRYVKAIALEQVAVLGMLHIITEGQARGDHRCIPEGLETAKISARVQQLA